MDIHGRDISTMDGEDIIPKTTFWRRHHPKNDFLEKTSSKKRFFGEDIIQKRLLGEDIIQKTTSWRRHHPKSDFLEKTSSKKRFFGEDIIQKMIFYYKINQKLILWISMVHD